MNLFDRVLLALYSLGIMITLLFAGLVAAGWTTPVIWLRAALQHTDSLIIIGVIVAVFLIVSIKFFLQALSAEKQPLQAVVQETDMGQVRVSVEAIKNMVNRVTSQIKGVRDVKPKVSAFPEGVSIFLRVSVTPETNIPSASDEIQNKVGAYIEDVAGIKVKAVKILVDSVSSETGQSGSRKLG